MSFFTNNFAHGLEWVCMANPDPSGRDEVLGFGETANEAWEDFFSKIENEWPDVTPGNVIFFQQTRITWKIPRGYEILELGY